MVFLPSKLGCNTADAASLSSPISTDHILSTLRLEILDFICDVSQKTILSRIDSFLIIGSLGISAVSDGLVSSTTFWFVPNTPAIYSAGLLEQLVKVIIKNSAVSYTHLTLPTTPYV